VFNIAFYAFTYFFYRTINARRDRVWNSWTEKARGQRSCTIKDPLTCRSQEREEYLATTTDRGNKRMDFRFAY
jgi:hypothetical protein